jgi:hypothetical protein
MAQSKKNIVDSIRNQATKFAISDETRLDVDWLSYKIDQVRAQLITAEYSKTYEVNPSWLSDVGTMTFYKVNAADDPSVTCNCTVSKTTIPQTINLPTPDGPADLGLFSVNSACGTKSYYYRRMFMWNYTPSCHTSSLFNYYDRIGTAMYVNKDVDKLRVVAVLMNPSDGFIKNSAPVATGSLVSGTTYKVMFGQIIYKSVVYAEGSTFTADATATYTGTGVAYLNSQATAFADTDPYPATADMIRQIELEILTKELAIEDKATVDQRNDSRDDANKGA